MSTNRVAQPPAGRPLRNIRRKRRKGYIPSIFQRFVMVAIATTALTLFSWAAIRIVVRPYVLGSQQSSVIEQQQAELKQIDAENDQLVRESAYLNRPDGIEAAARNQGYLKPGEESLVIETTPSSEAAKQ